MLNFEKKIENEDSNFLSTLSKMPNNTEYAKKNSYNFIDGASNEAFIKKLNENDKLNVNTQDTEGWSFLHYAVIRNNKWAAEKLLELGADVNIKSKNNETPLFIAVTFENIEMVEILLRHGAKEDVINKEGNHLLYIAEIKNNPELSNALNLETKKKTINIYYNPVMEIFKENCRRGK